ncbi:hypothetical protein KUCAC02_001035 [Chaenocephalus aceratus]|uniref:Uncharacterized protein n=1 Tax=Chaenocephalus aceratus TaxID=36190 RepID=A0ACB9XXL8_CHAAC|nr:hypothetical protein KUCAC02_001035 [Chaenocephalus aceratus]
MGRPHLRPRVSATRTLLRPSGAESIHQVVGTATCHSRHAREGEEGGYPSLHGGAMRVPQAGTIGNLQTPLKTGSPTLQYGPVEAIWVTKAVHCPEKGDYLLKVEEHKTNQSFGLAKMLLSSQEYGWLLSSIQMKNRLTAGSAKPKYVLFNTNASPSSLLTRYLQMAWLEMNLRGVPTFTSLRTAMATFARDRHGEDSEERHSMARFMCHDTATSDKYYAMDLTIKQARKGRLLFEQAQETTSTRTLHQCDAVDREDGGKKKKKKKKKNNTKKDEEESTPP